MNTPYGRCDLVRRLIGMDELLERALRGIQGLLSIHLVAIGDVPMGDHPYGRCDLVRRPLEWLISWSPLCSGSKGSCQYIW